jgi:small GTP-binding protein
MKDASIVSLKIVVLGAANVGKSCLIHRYCMRSFQSATRVNCGAGLFTRAVVVDDTEVLLLLWDTAGQEKFRSVTPILLRGANGVVLVYDLTEPHTFGELELYLKMFLDTVAVDDTCDLPVLLLGNKSDHPAPAVSVSSADEWCRETGVVRRFNVSAVTGENLDAAIATFVRALLHPHKRTREARVQVAPASGRAPGSERAPCC